jgi:outer membrane protein TolC
VSALELANQAYRAGATSNLELIDAERRARDAATTAVIAEDAVRQANLDLLSAAGRFP